MTDTLTFAAQYIIMAYAMVDKRSLKARELRGLFDGILGMLERV